MKATIYEKIRDCSVVGFHGWYNSNIGVVRKPTREVKTLDSLAEIDKVEEASYSPSFLKRIWGWLKRLFT